MIQDFPYFSFLYISVFAAIIRAACKPATSVEIGRYERYVCDWHFFLKDMQKIIRDTENEEITRNLNLYLLNQFYVQAFPGKGHS